MYQTRYSKMGEEALFAKFGQKAVDEGRVAHAGRQAKAGFLHRAADLVAKKDFFGLTAQEEKDLEEIAPEYWPALPR